MAWKVENGSEISRLSGTTPDLEIHLENWIEADPDIIDTDLLLIARQCPTDFGTYVDLLGMTGQGDLVIIELKKGRTPRETVAQALEYAAWASNLSYNRIIEIALPKHKSEENLSSAFSARFGCELPDTLNQTQKILLVAPVITDSVSTVIEYLSATHAVPINGISLSMFQVGENKVLVRNAVLEDSEVVPSTGTKRRAALSIEELLKLAAENGVGDIAEYLWSFNKNFPAPARYVTGWGFRMKGPEGSYLTVFTVFCTAETYPGRLGIAMTWENLSKIFGRSPEESKEFVETHVDNLGKPETGIWQSWRRFSIDSLDQAKQFMANLKEFTGMALESDYSEEAD